jgi:hypothetical protein
MRREQQASTTGNSRPKQTSKPSPQGQRDAVATDTGQKQTNENEDIVQCIKRPLSRPRYLLALLRRVGILLLDDFGECLPDINPVRHQAVLQLPDEAFVFLLRHPALLGGVRRRDPAALGGRLTVVPL